MSRARIVVLLCLLLSPSIVASIDPDHLSTKSESIFIRSPSRARIRQTYLTWGPLVTSCSVVSGCGSFRKVAVVNRSASRRKDEEERRSDVRVLIAR